MHKKTKYPRVLGHLLKVLPQSAGVVILSRQLNYNIVVSFFQVKIEERGRLYVYFYSIHYHKGWH